jgi:3-phenylpropionate/trans-cinnamate dioxygenase ferredoxin component
MWKTICAAGQVSESQPASITIGDKEVGVFFVGEQFYAIEDICPHAYARLSQGFVDGDSVECPLHEAVFHIPSGKCMKGPGGRAVQTYPVQVVKGQIQIFLQEEVDKALN